MKPYWTIAKIYLLLPVVLVSQASRGADLSDELQESYRIIAEEQKKIGALLRARLEEDPSGTVEALSREISRSGALPRSSVENQLKAAISLAITRDRVSVDELHQDTKVLFAELMHPERTADDSLAEAIFDQLDLPTEPADVLDFAKQSEKRIAWLSTASYYRRVAVYEYLSKQAEDRNEK